MILRGEFSRQHAGHQGQILRAWLQYALQLFVSLIQSLTELAPPEPMLCAVDPGAEEAMLPQPVLCKRSSAAPRRFLYHPLQLNLPASVLKLQWGTSSGLLLTRRRPCSVSSRKTLSMHLVGRCQMTLARANLSCDTWIGQGCFIPAGSICLRWTGCVGAIG